MKIIKKHSTLLFFSTILWLFSSLVSAGSSYNLQTHILSMPVVSIDGANLEVNLDFDGDKKFTLIDSKPSTQSSDQPVVFNSATRVATIPYVVVAETGQAYTATLTLISSNPVVTMELTSLKKIDEDSTIVIQEIYNLNLKHNDICRKGDQIRVKGLNLDKLESPDLMLASISIARIAKYIKKEEEALYFECQETEHYGDIDIFLKSDTVASRATVLTSLAVSTPVITDVSYNSTTNKITVTGFNLNKQLTINLGDVNVKLDQQNGDPDTFSFTAYALIKLGELKIIADDVHSNSIWVKINKTIKGKIEFVSNGVDTTHLVVGVNEDDKHPSVSGDFQSDAHRGRSTLIPVFIHSPDQTARPEYILHLAAIALPEDDFVEVSPFSTAMALLWSSMSVELNILPKDYVVFREQIAATPETILFANLFAQTLTTNPYVLQEKFQAGELYNASIDAITATYQLIKRYQSERVQKKHDLFSKKSDSKKAWVTPKKADDIEVYENDNEKGNITVKNNTQLFLAVRVKDVDGNILQDYPSGTSGVFSSLIAEPQGIVFASKTSYMQPQGKHSTVRVLTPGFDHEHYPLFHQRYDIETALVIRTVVERVIFPFIEAFFDVNGEVVSQIIITSVPIVVNAVGKSLADGNIEAAIAAITNGIKNDFLGSAGPGPIARYYMRINAIPSIREIAALIAQKLGMQLVPFVGMFDNAMKAIELLSAGTKAVVATTDLYTTDRAIDFNIQFSSTITSVYPSQIPNADLANNNTLNILGANLGAVPDEDGQKVLPEVLVRDGDGNIKIIPVNPDHIITTPDGSKELNIPFPDEFKKPTTKFPLDLAIRHPTTNSNPDFPIVENAIDLISGFQITGIDRDEGLVLNGYCHGVLGYPDKRSFADLKWTDGSSISRQIFLNRKLLVCELPSPNPNVHKINCLDSARTSYNRADGNNGLSNYIQTEGAITDVFKAYPIHSNFDFISMPYSCPDAFITVDPDPNKKYRVEWEIFLEKRRFNSDSGLYEPIEKTQTVNFAYDCHYF